MGTSAALAPILARLESPPEITGTLQSLLDELVDRLKKNLSGFVLYGSLARQRYRPGRSDVNVALVLQEITSSTLSDIGPSLQKAWRAVRIEPMVLSVGEVAQLAQVFPLKFLDIQAHHIALYGEDPFVNLQVCPDRIRWRLEQQLRNLRLRLRRRYLVVANDPPLLLRLLADSARSLAVDLSGLMHLTGKPLPTEDHTDTRLHSAAEAFELDDSFLEELANLRRATRPPADLNRLFDQLLATIDRALEHVQQVKEPS